VSIGPIAPVLRNLLSTYRSAEQHRIQLPFTKRSANVLEGEEWYQRNKQDHCYTDEAPKTSAANSGDAGCDGLPHQKAGDHFFHYMEADKQNRKEQRLMQDWVD
jgi:hypothetical protein